MGTGYTRADLANNISNGNVIDADDLDNEFNAIEAAFNSGSGHTHDGTAEEGAPITVIGPNQDVVAAATTLRPKTTNTVDLGTSSLKYKDAYLAGDLSLGDAATIGGALSVTGTSTLAAVSVSGNQTNTGNLTVNGNTTLGDAATDTVTVNADIASSLIPSVDDSYDLGAVGSEWRDAYIDGTAYIDTGSIDTANVGTLAVSGNATVTGDLTVDGNINATVVGVASSANKLTTARTITIAGVTSGAANFDGSANITITTTGLSIGGTAITADAAEINKLDGMTATQTELNKLAGLTASTTELNYNDITTLGISQASKTVTASASGNVYIAGELQALAYNETYVGLTSASNSTTIDCEAANVFAITLDENTTFTFSNPPSSGTAYGFVLKVGQDTTGGYTVTWPSSVVWRFGNAPVITSNANSEDVFVFFTYSGGTTWYGFIAANNMS